MVQIDGFTIEIDRDVCMGSGVCIVYAAATFSMDEAAKAVVLDPPGGDLESVRTAVEGCPTGAIKLVPTV